MGPTEATERRASPRVDDVQLVQVSEPSSLVRADDRANPEHLARWRAPRDERSVCRCGSRVRLSLAVGDEFLTVGGSVVYLEALDDGRCSMGVQFTDLDAGSRRRLDDHVLATLRSDHQTEAKRKPAPQLDHGRPAASRSTSAAVQAWSSETSPS